MKEIVGEFERELKISPAFDRRSDDPKKNYGIHGVEMRWLLKGKLGVIQFVLYTNWQLDHVDEEQKKKFEKADYSYVHALYMPLPADIGYHSPKPMHEGQEPMWPTKLEFNKEDPLKSKFPKIGKQPPVCEYLGVPCYYDGSSLYAEKVFAVLKAEGEDGLWKFLENYYNDTFNGS